MVDVYQLEFIPATKEDWHEKTRVSNLCCGQIKGLYFFFDSQKTICYIGKSNDIRQRIHQHLFDLRITQNHLFVTSKVYKEEIYFFAFTQYQESDLLKVEKKLIKQYTPRMNSPYDLIHYGFTKDKFNDRAAFDRYEESQSSIYLSL